MIHFTTFWKADGRVMMSGTCQEIGHAPVETGEVGVILTACDPNSTYVVDGALRPMPPRPSSHHNFDHTARRWVDGRTVETEWMQIRWRRAALLAESDWTQMPDVPLTAKGAWAAYRQALRDVTQQSDPFSIVWPAAPS